MFISSGLSAQVLVQFLGHPLIKAVPIVGWSLGFIQLFFMGPTVGNVITGGLSASKLFLSRIFPKKSYDIDTNYHGGPPFVVNGEYEKVLPMDIYPVYLLKAVLAGDIDKMEQLGIYEILPENFALCEFVCTSKTPVQEIVRKGTQ